MTEHASPTSTTRLVALLGDPVAHSLSPVIQNAAFRHAGVDGVYLALRCGVADAPGLLRALARAGGAGNVTVPHKQLAAACLDRRTAAVERTDACNTFWAEDGAVVGDNTDVAGFAAAVRMLIGAPAGARVLMLGAGGAARAAVLALLDAGADEILLLNRTPARAEALRDAFDAQRRRLRVAAPGAVPRAVEFDLLVNATPLGLRGDDPLPMDPADGPRIRAILDLAYGPGGTPLVRRARDLGIPAADGREMLLHQGAAAFARWWGREAPIDAMRAALAAAASDPHRG